MLWKRILNKCRAKVVISILPDTGLCRAACQLGVQVFDLQHGIIDMEHDPYYRSKRLEARCKADLPSGYLTWDEQTAGMLLPVAMKKGIAVRVIGNPWFARFAAPHESDGLVTEAMHIYAKANPSLPTILVTLQYGLEQFANDYVTNGVMADCLIQTIRETCDRYAWKVRLHPSQINGVDSSCVQTFLQAEFGQCKNVDWQACSRAPLPLLLAHTNLHITHFSATTIEAASMGLLTGLLDPHIRPGGKHAHFLASERARNLAHPLPLEVEAIKQFIASAIKERRVRSGSSALYMTQLTSHRFGLMRMFQEPLNGVSDSLGV